MSTLANPVILVVDGDSISLTATAAVLHTTGFDVYCAQDQQAAVKAAADYELDLVLCDVDVDGTPGEEIVAKIHGVPNREDVPVIYASSCQVPEVIRKVQNGDAFYHLRKPFDPLVLMELVDKALWLPHLVQNHIRQPHFRVATHSANHSAAIAPTHD